MTHTSNIKTIPLAVCTALCALTVPASAAQDDNALPQATLNIAGTDFTSSKSVAHLKRRVRYTALEICAPDWDRRRLMAPDEQRCYETALNNGIAQVESRRQEALRRTSVDMAEAQPADGPIH